MFLTVCFLVGRKRYNIALTLLRLLAIIVIGIMPAFSDARGVVSKQSAASERLQLL
jgi:hypothetical protein